MTRKNKGENVPVLSTPVQKQNIPLSLTQPMCHGVANLCSVLGKQKEKKGPLLNLIFCLSH